MSSSTFAGLKGEVERRSLEAAAARAVATASAPAASIGAMGKKYVRRGDLPARPAGATAGVAGGAGGAAPPTFAVDASALTAAAPVAPAATAHAAAATAHAAAASASASASATASAAAHAAAVAVPRGEVMRALRAHGLVVTYFGEPDAARALRLHAMQVGSLADAAETGVRGGWEHAGGRRGGGGGGGAGVGDAGDDDEDGEGASPPGSKRPRRDGGVGSDAVASGAGGTGSGGIGSGGERPPGATGGGDGSDGEAGGGDGGRGDKRRAHSSDAAQYRTSDPHKYLYRYLKGLLNEWEDDLAARPEAERGTSAARAEARTLKQCKDFIRPFFRMAKAGTLPRDILHLACEIVDHCRARDYHMAGDAYIRLAIGNAAWPIGVSAVGLHERAAREKVGEGVQAHVMNDEAQRKYITTIKRLITYAQGRYPSDPSRSVYS